MNPQYCIKTNIMILSLEECNECWIELWWKIKNLVLLSNKGFNIPKSLIVAWKISKKDLLEAYDSWLWSDLYIVRSSATVEDGVENSFAGIFDSVEGFYNYWKLFEDYLYVLGSLNWDAFKIYVKRKNISIQSPLKMNILIQEYIWGEYSWVFFSSYKWGMYLEFIKGGNAFLVNGIVIPNKVVINSEYSEESFLKWEQSRYLDRLLNINFMDTENEITELNTFRKAWLKKVLVVMERIVQFFSFEVDVEWTIRGGEVFVLQVRPITRN